MFFKVGGQHILVLAGYVKSQHETHQQLVGVLRKQRRRCAGTRSGDGRGGGLAIGKFRSVADI